MSNGSDSNGGGEGDGGDEGPTLDMDTIGDPEPTEVELSEEPDGSTDVATEFGGDSDGSGSDGDE